MLLALVASAFGWSPTSCALSGKCTVGCHSRCSPLVAEADFSRRVALRNAAIGAALGVVGGLSPASPAWAGYITSLGIQTTKPADADKDDELLASKEVQNSLNNIRAYRQAAASLRARFESDSNMQLIPLIRKEFDFSQVRDDLNVAVSVFDEQTQLTTDRIERSILYDLTELENASRFKKGDPERTPKKVASVLKWFGKLDLDLNDILSYY